MVTLEDYKKYIIDYIRYEYDNNEARREEREKELSRKYSNLYLQKIVNDSYSFLQDIFSSDTIQHGYVVIPLDDDTTDYISLNIIGGGFADTIFQDNSGKTISRHILRDVFGPQLDIGVSFDESVFVEDDGLASLSYDYYIYAQGFPKNMKEIKEEYLGYEKKKV